MCQTCCCMDHVAAHFTLRQCVLVCIVRRPLVHVSFESRDELQPHSPPLPSGSEEERIAVETASLYGSKPNVYPTAVAKDVCVEVKMEGEGPMMGADAQLSIVVKNLSSQPRRTTLHSQVAVMYYTGVLKGTIKKEQLPVELLPNEGWLSSETIQLLLSMFNTGLLHSLR